VIVGERKFARPGLPAPDQARLAEAVSAPGPDEMRLEPAVLFLFEIAQVASEADQRAELVERLDHLGLLAGIAAGQGGEASRL